MESFKTELERIVQEGKLSLKPTQTKISVPIAFRIFQKMMVNLRFDAIKVCDGMIMDGHHRFVASVLANVKLEQFPSTKNHNQNTIDWGDVALVTTDFDNQDTIDYHNFNDAQRNKLTLDALKLLLNP